MRAEGTYRRTSADIFLQPDSAVKGAAKLDHCGAGTPDRRVACEHSLGVVRLPPKLLKELVAGEGFELAKFRNLVLIGDAWGFLARSSAVGPTRSRRFRLVAPQPGEASD